MRILFFILIFFIFSCEDELGVQEYQESFNYYDFVAYGWAEYKSQNYQKAIDWFEQSLTINDVDQNGVEDNVHNSAYVGISWAKTQLINSSLSNDSENIDEERINALKYLLLNENAGIWNEISDISNDICIPPTIWEDGSCLFDMSEIDISVAEIK